MNIRKYLPPIPKTRRTGAQITRRFVTYRWMERQPERYDQLLPGMLVTAGYARRVGQDLYEFEHDPSPHALNVSMAECVGVMPSVKEFQARWETDPWFVLQRQLRWATFAFLGGVVLLGGSLLVADFARTGLKPRAIAYLSQPERCWSCGVQKVWRDTFPPSKD